MEKKEREELNKENQREMGRILMKRERKRGCRREREGLEEEKWGWEKEIGGIIFKTILMADKEIKAEGF